MQPVYHIRIWAIVAASLSLSAIRASDFSVQPTVALTLEGWSLFDGGVDTGESSLGLLQLGSDFSIGDKTHGHVGAFLFSGDNDVDSFTGDFGVYSNVITDSRYILFTTWLQSDFQDSSFKWGQLAVDETFFVSETGSLFINSNFGAIPTVSANVSAPVFSVGAAGAEYRHNGNHGYLQIGAYAGDSGPGDKDDHGFNWEAGGQAGYFFILERSLDYKLNRSKLGTIKIGGYYHTGQFESFETNRSSRGLASIYGVSDHKLSESLSFFVRAGFNPDSERSVVTRYVDVGTAWRPFSETRPQDIMGIAYSHTRFSDSFAKSEPLVSNSRGEQVLEITYSTQLAGEWMTQPSLQWIIDPINATEDALVGGLRLFREF
ncbi:MAG: carbohydrate porin [Verrucomicrobiota bacterium]|nr:carbohydrate porin [Verrucomicrobiota bacterium]